MTTIRAGTSLDLRFLEQMLYEAFFWNSSVERPPFIEARGRPEFSSLLADWGRAGDVAHIAEHGGVAVGAAWFRLWTTDAHSYGFVDEKTPELAVGVVSSFRGVGVGRALVRATIDSATGRAYPGLSLSVAPANRARQLYESEGFYKIDEVGTSWTMWLKLPRSPGARPNPTLPRT